MHILTARLVGTVILLIQLESIASRIFTCVVQNIKLGPIPSRAQRLLLTIPEQ